MTEKGLTLNEAIINIRVELQNLKLKKSGLNKFAGFTYFELADFMPTLNTLMQKYQVNDIITIESDTITLKLTKGAECNSYSMPFVIYETPVNRQGQKSMQDIQYLGALNTYYKRYLYLNAFGITDGEIIDSMDNSNLVEQANKTQLDKIVSYGAELVKPHLNKLGKAKTSDLTKEQADELLKTLAKEKSEE